MNKIFVFMRESSTARFFIPVGILLIIVGMIVFNINMNNQNYIKTEAIVSHVELLEESYTDSDGNQFEATYSVTVKYTVDEKEYTSSLDNVSKYNIGDKITIYYNPKDPSQITQTKSLILPIVIIIVGIASFTGGVISAVNSIKRHNKMKEQERSWQNAN